MKKILIATTIEDKSLPLFFSQKNTHDNTIDILLLEEKLNDIKNFVQKKTFDLIYIRDPFNAGHINNIDKKIELIINFNKETKFVDNIETINDIYWEDKWVQYKILKKFMPETIIMKKNKFYNLSNWFIKKRISCRGRGIVLNLKKIKANYQTYIVQKKINIKKEYRVFCVKQKICQIITGKKLIIEDPINNKVKVKILEPQKIPKKIDSFIKKINKLIKFDFIGYDIAENINNELKIIEVNRSPQFLVFYQETNINLAAELINSLI